jgi:hypothetical protein
LWFPLISAGQRTENPQGRKEIVGRINGKDTLRIEDVVAIIEAGLLKAQLEEGFAS